MAINAKHDPLKAGANPSSTAGKPAPDLIGGTGLTPDMVTAPTTPAPPAAPDLIGGTGLTPDMVTAPTTPAPPADPDLIGGTGLTPDMVTAPTTPAPPTKLPDASGTGGNGSTTEAPPSNLPTTETPASGGSTTEVPPSNLPATSETPTENPESKVPTIVPYYQPGSQQARLDSWLEAAKKTQSEKIDNATARAIADLMRAEEEAKAQMKEQAEAVSLDERQGMDNAALYAEARGDKGGIGASQYNEIQAAGAQNRLAIQQAQTKLATDTQQQIADLRAKGEFEKADALLELSQTYLTELNNLEKWAAEMNLDVDKLNADISMWLKEFKLESEKFTHNKGMDEREMALKESQTSAEITEARRQELISMGKAMLNAGIPVTNAEMLAAMELTPDQAKAMALAAQMGGTPGATNTGYKTTTELFEAVKAAGGTDADSAKAALRIIGVSDPDDFIDAYMTWYESSNKPDGGKTPLSSEDGSKIYVPGYGMVTWTTAQDLVQKGEIYVLSHDENGDPIFAKTPAANALGGGLIPPAGGFTGGK